MAHRALRRPRARPTDEVDPSGVDDGLRPLLVGTLAAHWTYTSGDVTFDPARQGVRAAIVETFRLQYKPLGPADVGYIAEVVSSYQEISDIAFCSTSGPTGR